MNGTLAESGSDTLTDCDAVTTSPVLYLLSTHIDTRWVLVTVTLYLAAVKCGGDTRPCGVTRSGILPGLQRFTGYRE